MKSVFAFACAGLLLATGCRTEYIGWSDPDVDEVGPRHIDSSRVPAEAPEPTLLGLNPPEDQGALTPTGVDNPPRSSAPPLEEEFPEDYPEDVSEDYSRDASQGGTGQTTNRVYRQSPF